MEAKSVRGAGDVAEAGVSLEAARRSPPGVPSAAELGSLDVEEPAARSRRAFIGISFVAGIVCLMPQQWASGALCLAVALAAYVWHRRKLAQEGATAPVAPHPAAESPRDPA